MQKENHLFIFVYRYKKFLQIKQSHPALFIVPYYDIDLVWHAHQMHPQEYYSDTVLVLGQLFPHDDTDTDRGVGSKLEVVF